MEVEIELLKHQMEFVEDTTTEYLGLCAGFGAGKTYAFVVKAISLAMDNVGFQIALLEPTNPLIGLILVPKLEEILDEFNIPYSTKTRPVPTYTLHFEKGDCDLILLSAENYSRQIGIEVAAFGVDEVDTIKKDVAEKMFIKLAGRKRGQAPVKQGFFVSTPEGFSWMHDFFVENIEEDNRRLIRATTYDNPFLDAEYIPGLKKIYPPNLIEAYLNGQFVNLTAGNVYHDFDRELNATTKTMDDFPNHPLHIGIDFNIMKMPATVFVIDDGDPLALDEFYGDRDTATLIRSIQEKYPNRVINIYPDSSAGAEKTNASSSDMQQLKLAFGRRNVFHLTKNPLVVTRINCVNGLICNGESIRRLRINTKSCNRLTEALEQQPYKDGKPDKSYKYDDCADSMGYFLFTKFQTKSQKVRLYG